MHDLDLQLPTQDSIAAELPPVSGRTIIHVMTQAEISEYVSVEVAEAEMHAAQDLLLSEMADEQRDAWLNAVRGVGAYQAHLISDQEFCEFLKRKAKHEYLRAQFWFRIRSGRNSWNSRLAVAHGWKIVNSGKKYATDELR